jgi:hypothetical protein
MSIDKNKHTKSLPDLEIIASAAPTTTDTTTTLLQEEEESAFNRSIRSVLQNDTLTEEQKCYLLMTIAEHRLYKTDPEFTGCQFTLETREDPNRPGEVAYTFKSKSEVKAKKRRKKKRIRRVLVGLTAPTIGAILGVFVRRCCFPS